MKRNPSRSGTRSLADELAELRGFNAIAGSRMGEVFIWRLFNQVAIKPAVWGEPTDQYRRARCRSGRYGGDCTSHCSQWRPIVEGDLS
jgi:hypothetical protein